MLGVGAQNNKGDVRHFPLILYKSQLQFVFSDYQLLPGNFKIEIRETGGGVKQEFDYIDGYIDKASIQAFVGANSGYISAMYEQKTGVKVDVTVEAQQRRIINAGVWVNYTHEYNLEISQNTLLSVSGIAALNRLKHMDMCSYIGFKGSVTVPGYTPDYVFIIKMLANSKNDFGFVNLDNPFWYFRDGVTSQLLNPSVTCVPGGNDYVFGTNITDNDIQLACNTTGANWVGDIRDLPRLTYYLAIGGSSGLTGNVNNLPALKSFLSMWGCVLVTGNVNDIPKVDTHLNIGSCGLLTGLISNMPSVSGTFSVDACVLLTGVYAPLATTNIMYFSWTNMSATDTDNVLIAIAAITTVIGGTLFIKANRTPASNAAFTHLSVAHTWAITEV